MFAISKAANADRFREHTILKRFLKTTVYSTLQQLWFTICFIYSFLHLQMNVIVQIDTVQHHHAHDATSQQVLHLLSSYLKMAYHRNMGGAWKAARLRLAETSAIPGTAANNEGEPLTNGNADEAIGRM